MDDENAHARLCTIRELLDGDLDSEVITNKWGPHTGPVSPRGPTPSPNVD